MNNLKPYLYWVIIGVVLFVELVIYILALPDVDVVGNAAAARSSKTELDREYLHLAELDRKAKNASPQGVFDAENADDIKRLTDDFLITGTWKAVLDPHVEKYEKHLKAIRAHLAERSAILSKPLADSGDKLGWYTAYQGATEALLKQLYAADCLVLPATAQAPAAVDPKDPGRAASVDAPAPEVDFTVAKEVREVAGFYTKVSDYPESSEHPTLTIRYRIVERLAALILQSAAANTAGATPTSDQPAPVKPRLRALTWGEQAVVPGGGVATYGSGVALTVTLQGPLSSLLAVQAAIERSDTGPVLVVQGVTLGRKAAYGAGERKDVAFEQGEMKLNLLALNLNAPEAPVAPPAQPHAGQDGVPPADAPPPRRKRKVHQGTEGEAQ